MRTAVPHWRIVDDDLWTAAHRRIAAAAQVYLRDTNGRVWGRPPSEMASKYLLSGKLRCACCGASMTVRSRAQGGKRFYYYACASYDTKGKNVCGNSLLLPMKGAHDEIVGKVSSLLAPEIVEGALADAVEALRARSGGDEGRREALRREMGVAAAEQARLVEAIAGAGDIAALTKALKDRERRRAHLQQELAALDARAVQVVRFLGCGPRAAATGRRVARARGAQHANSAAGARPSPD